MNERQLQFRVGLFVIAALATTGLMVFNFGNLKQLWEPQYTLVIHFDSAPGIRPETPVRRSGISIGEVREVVFDEEHGGVLVLVDVRESVRLRKDSVPNLTLSLLGDATIDFAPGKNSEFLGPGDLLKGRPPVDPMQLVTRMEEKMSTTLDSFHSTSSEWEQVGRNLNDLMDTNHGNLNLVIERTAGALHQFTLTMKNADKTLNAANQIIADPQNRANLKKALAAMPKLVDETFETISAVKNAIHTADENLANLAKVTAPMARRSNSIVTRLDNTLGNLESLSRELKNFSQVLSKEDGSLQKLISDPALYRNLNNSAASLSVLLKNLDPIVRDIRFFSDKVARHPELLGVGGALKGSSGLKDSDEERPYRQSAGRRQNRRSKR